MELIILPEAQRQFMGMPRPIQQRMREIMARLLQWPAVSGAKPLRHNLKGHYRIRTGDWRMVFRVSGTLITVVALDHRKDIYED